MGSTLPSLERLYIPFSVPGPMRHTPSYKASDILKSENHRPSTPEMNPEHPPPHPHRMRALPLVAQLDAGGAPDGTGVSRPNGTRTLPDETRHILDTHVVDDSNGPCQHDDGSSSPVSRPPSMPPVMGVSRDVHPHGGGRSHLPDPDTPLGLPWACI